MIGLSNLFKVWVPGGKRAGFYFFHLHSETDNILIGVTGRCSISILLHDFVDTPDTTNSEQRIIRSKYAFHKKYKA